MGNMETMSYRERLIELQLFPLMYYLDLQDVLFLLKCIKYPPDNFDVFSYISFCKSNTRSSSMGKLKYVYKRLSTTRHFYFNRVPYSGYISFRKMFVLSRTRDFRSFYFRSCVDITN